MNPIKNIVNFAKSNKFETLLILYAFFLPLRNNISGLILYFLLLYIVINFRDFKCYLLNAKRNKFFYISLLIFFLHILGLVYTTNFNYALKDIDIKLPLFIFPFLLVGKLISSKAIQNVMKSFVFGCLIGVIGAFINGFSKFLKSGVISDMFYEGMNFVMHSSYFAMYLVFSVTYVLITLNGNEKLISYRNIIRFFLILFFIILVILLNSRAGILSLGVMLFFLLFFILRERKLKLFFFLMSILTITFVLMMSTSGKIFKRFTPAQNETQSVVQTSNINSKDARLAILEIGIDVFKNSPIYGYGTGDVKDELIKGYRKYNFIKGYEKSYNAHNQYLQFLIAFGIIGLIVFLIVLIYPSFLALQSKNYLFLFLIVLIGFNFLFESMLETKAGVEFFAFFYSLLLLAKRTITE